VGSEKAGDEVLKQATHALSMLPLCDRCLGRLLAYYGYALHNEERGRALKTVLSMEIHRRILAGDEGALKELEQLAANACGPLAKLASKYVGEVRCNECRICGGRLDDLIYELCLKALNALKNYEVRTFIVGVKSGSSLEKREEEVALSLGLESWETISREIKREVGKRLQLMTGLRPNFRKYDVVILVDLDEGSVTIQPQPLYILGRYLKLGRFISQMPWIGRDGVKRYVMSVEESCRGLMEVYGAEDLKMHASGREDADARMLGRGRPLVVELRKPKRRFVNLKKASAKASRPPWVVVNLERYVSFNEVVRLKQERGVKVYRLVLYVDPPISDEDLVTLENEFRDRLVKQRTPSRVLRRRADIVRERTVFSVKARRLTPHVIEVLVKCEGGLYVKELAHGDDGRTEPSFSSVLGKEVSVLFLDVLECLSE